MPQDHDELTKKRARCKRKAGISIGCKSIDAHDTVFEFTIWISTTDTRLVPEIIKDWLDKGFFRDRTSCAIKEGV